MLNNQFPIESVRSISLIIRLGLRKRGREMKEGVERAQRLAERKIEKWRKKVMEMRKKMRERGR